jgi:hypothetical protein
MVLRWFYLGMGIPVMAFATTTPPPALPADPIFFNTTGYIDGSYNYLYRSNRFTSGVYNRVNDLEPNGFTLQQAAVTFAKQPADGFGALLNFILGRDANNLAPYGMNPSIGIQNIGFAVSQAFLQYKNTAYTTFGGLLNSLAGAENYNPTTDTNFSRSILDGFAQPGTFLGLRESYVLDDKINLFAGINNGWDTIEDTSRRMTMELGVITQLSPQFTLSLQGYNGQQRAMNGATVGPTGIRNGVDLIAIYDASQKLSYMINYDYVIQNRANLPGNNLGRAIWDGIAGYVNYKFTEHWQTSLRAELFSDPQGYATGVPQTWKEATITLGYTPLPHLILRAETRRDFSNVNSFIAKNGHKTANNQQSFGCEALYIFS